MDCQFTDPLMVKKVGEVISYVSPYDVSKPWSYSKVNCTGDLGGGTSNNYEEITDPTTGKTFFLDKSISYGSALTSFFILTIIILLIANFLFKIIVKRN